MVGFMPNHFTFAAVLKACIGLEAFNVGKSVHGCIIITCYKTDLYVGVGLLDLYFESRDASNVLQVFGEIPEIDVIP